MLIETKKQVMHYKLKIKEELESKNKDKLERMRAERRKRRAAKQKDKDQNLPFKRDFGGDEFNNRYPASDGEQQSDGFAPSDDEH